MAILAPDVAPAVVAEPSEDIVVVARQLRRVALSYSVEKGTVRSCTVRPAETSPVAVAIACDAVRQCAGENPTLGDRHLAPCLKGRIRSLFIAYRARRGARPES